MFFETTADNKKIIKIDLISQLSTFVYTYVYTKSIYRQKKINHKKNESTKYKIYIQRTENIDFFYYAENIYRDNHFKLPELICIKKVFYEKIYLNLMTDLTTAALQ